MLVGSVASATLMQTCAARIRKTLPLVVQISRGSVVHSVHHVENWAAKILGPSAQGAEGYTRHFLCQSCVRELVTNHHKRYNLWKVGRVERRLRSRRNLLLINNL